MAEQSQSWITIDSCIYDYLVESEQSNHKFYKLWQLAFRGMSEMGLDFFYQIRSVKLPINSNKTVTLPADFINFTKVGVFNEIGEVIPLEYNSKLTTYADLSPDRKSKTEDDTLLTNFIFNSPVFYNFWNGYMFSNIYGVPSGAPFIGSFKLDLGNNIILLSENFCYPYICLEYVASPQEGEQYYVPIQFREALIAYLAWMDIRNKPTTSHFNLGDKRDRRREFYNQRRLARARWRPLHWEEAYNWSLKNLRLAIKAG